MGLLTNLLNAHLDRKHQTERDEIFRDYETNKSIAFDVRPINQGGFSPEAKDRALRNMAVTVTGNKKHAEGILPMLRGLTGLGQLTGGRMGGGGGIPGLLGMGKTGDQQGAQGRPMGPGDTAGASPGVLLMGGAPNATASDMLNPPASPSTLVEGPSADEELGPDWEMQQQAQAQAQAQPTPAQPAQPAQPTGPSLQQRATIAKQPQGQPQAQSRPSQPSQMPDTRVQPIQGPGQFKSDYFPSQEQITAYSKQQWDEQTNNLLARKKAEGATTLDLSIAQRDRNLQWFKEHKGDFGGEAYAVLASGLGNPAGGAYTGPISAQNAAAAPIGKENVLQGTDPKTGLPAVGTVNRAGVFTAVPGLKVPVEKVGVEKEVRDDQLAAYAKHLGKTVDQLDPQERVDAVTRLSGQMKQIMDAQAIMVDPNALPAEKKAAELYLKGLSLNQQKVAFQIQIEREKVADLNAGNIDVQMRDPALPPTVRDPGVIAKLSVMQQERIKQMVDYRMPVTAYMITRSKELEALATAAGIYDPNFNVPQYDIRKRIRTSYLVDPTARNIRSIDTAIAHMGTLHEMSEALHNGNTRLWNYLKNTLSSELEGNPAINNMDVAITAVVDELATVFKNTGATDLTIREWGKKVSSSLAPQVIYGMIQTGLKLVGGRMGSIANAWHNAQAMGETPFNFISPRAAAALKKFQTPLEEMGLRPQDLPQETRQPVTEIPQGQAQAPITIPGQGSGGRGGAPVQMQKQPWQTPPRAGAALDSTTAQKYMGLAGGDYATAEKLAVADGWNVTVKK